MAQVAEVEVVEGAIVVRDVKVAVDCGLVVNPAGAALQAQGSVVMGLSSTLREELTVSAGMIEQTNLDTYQLLRLADTPPIEVVFVEGGDEPRGMGEPVIGPVGAAVANARGRSHRDPAAPAAVAALRAAPTTRFLTGWAPGATTPATSKNRLRLACGLVGGGFPLVAGTGFEPVTSGL